jgi:hypothetical protein
MTAMPYPSAPEVINNMQSLNPTRNVTRPLPTRSPNPWPTRLLLLLLFMAPTGIALAGDLEPFTTDGCSAFPDGTPDQRSLWIECCIRHDLAYWKGGTEAERKTADEALQACVAQVGEPEIAKLMLAGVRVGGSPYLPTPFRWGYGWPYKRGYQALTEAERTEVRQQMARLKSIIEVLSNELNAATDTH